MGPLAGLKIIELTGIGPGPFCGMMLAEEAGDIVVEDEVLPTLSSGDTAPADDLDELSKTIDADFEKDDSGDRPENQSSLFSPEEEAEMEQQIAAESEA